jgi:exonuclease III
MIGVIWNCQGLVKAGKFEFLQELITKYKVDFIGLQETKKNFFEQSWFEAVNPQKNFTWISSPPKGRSGGLLVGFNTDIFDVISQDTSEFMISCLIHHKYKNISWNFINVYGAAQIENKDRFLSEFSSICSKSKGPTIFGGDFNVIRTNEEKNKPGILSKWSNLFNSIIEMHGLIELDLSDRLYTWSNNRDNPTFEKLDRFLVNPDWDLLFHNAMVRGLDRSLSDHVPLLLKTEEKKKHSDEFRYELSWKFRPGFRDIVFNNWSLPVRSKKSIDVWKEKVKRMKKVLKGWNINEEGKKGGK